MHGLSPGKALARIGYAKRSQSWSNWESGYTAPPYETLLRIIAATGLGHSGRRGGKQGHRPRSSPRLLANRSGTEEPETSGPSEKSPGTPRSADPELLKLALSSQEALRVLQEPELYVEVDPGTGCWYWPFTASTGYGPFLAFFAAAFGEPPDGMDVFHSCRGGERGCIRPSHIDTAPFGTKMRHVPDNRRLDAGRRSGFGERLRSEREARRLTAAEFAEELGFPQSRYSGWERGAFAPEMGDYDAIATRLGWDGHMRRYVVLVALERTVEAKSAGEAAAAVLSEMEIDGRPLKAQVIRTAIKP